MKIRLPEKQVAGVIAFFIRLMIRSIRVKLHDPVGLVCGDFSEPCICVVWHNRILGLLMTAQNWAKTSAMTVLTSPSRDGELLAQVLAQFGYKAVRGSSKKRGAVALLALRDCLKAGDTVFITPDGPRGPMYRLNPGVILLAQKTGVPVFIIHVGFSRSKRLKSWDRFHVPLPFSEVNIWIIPSGILPPTQSPEDFELQRLALEKQLSRDDSEG